MFDLRELLAIFLFSLQSLSLSLSLVPISQIFFSFFRLLHDSTTHHVRNTKILLHVICEYLVSYRILCVRLFVAAVTAAASMLRWRDFQLGRAHRIVWRTETKTSSSLLLLLLSFKDDTSTRKRIVFPLIYIKMSQFTYEPNSALLYVLIVYLLDFFVVCSFVRSSEDVLTAAPKNQTTIFSRWLFIC